MSILKQKKLNNLFTNYRNRFDKDGHNRIKPPILQNEGYIQAIRTPSFFFMLFVPIPRLLCIILKYLETP